MRLGARSSRSGSSGLAPGAHVELGIVPALDRLADILLRRSRRPGPEGILEDDRLARILLRLIDRGRIGAGAILDEEAALGRERRRIELFRRAQGSSGGLERLGTLRHPARLVARAGVD